METQMGAMVDLQQSSVFEEPFYIVVLERTGMGTTVHMWRLVIASQPATPGIVFCIEIIQFLFEFQINSNLIFFFTTFRNVWEHDVCTR